MLRFLIVPVVTAVLSAGSALAAPVTFDWAHVGNAGNAPDLQTDLSVGAVAYDYAISKTEVTNAQYVEFLNAVDPTGANSLELFSVNMTSKFGGITNDGLDDGFHYVARAGREHHPVAFVSWYDAIRFVNWLHNGQGNGDTDTGAYTLLGGTPVPSNRFGVTRNPGARFWLPSEDEWYKAAFHDATAGTAGVYFDFATGSNAI
ncbi:MAG: SUMF1/EgtB/PvdO family nonheme iron enzyme, partial [Planctomycetales bacterium]|nr:SUMF1/EgtB/PvdO family nonheme iron enzyme [Planctomycetales bacterium]